MPVKMLRNTLVIALAIVAVVVGFGSWGPTRDLWDSYVGDPLAELFRGSITVTAHFQDSVGLYEGNVVMVLGMPIGKVVRIEPHGTKVIVEMEVADDVDLPADVGAVTVSPSVVTNRNVELTPVYRGGPKLADGAVIPLKRTRTPVEIDRVIKAVDELAGELGKTEGGKRAIADALDVASKNFAGNGKRLRQALSSLAAATDSAAKHRDPLVRLIKEIDQLTAAAAKQRGTIDSFTRNLTSATELFAEQAPALRATLKQVNELLAEADVLVRDNADSIKATLANARTTSETLAKHTGAMAETVDVLPLLLQNLARAVDTDTNELRTHLGLDEAVIGQVQTVCDILGVTVPSCDSRTPGLLPDLGITALLEAVTPR